MTTIIQDTFDGPNGTNILSHTPNIGGPWIRGFNYPAILQDILLDGSGGIKPTRDSSNPYLFTSASVFNATKIDSPDCWAEVDFTVNGGNLDENSYFHLLLRGDTDPNTTAFPGESYNFLDTYFLKYPTDIGTGLGFPWDLPIYNVAGGRVAFGTAGLNNSSDYVDDADDPLGGPLTPGDYTMRFQVFGNTMETYLNGVLRVTATNTLPEAMAAGWAGFYFYSSKFGGVDTGIDYFTIKEFRAGSLDSVASPFVSEARAIESAFEIVKSHAKSQSYQRKRMALNNFATALNQYGLTEEQKALMRLSIKEGGQTDAVRALMNIPPPPEPAKPPAPPPCDC